MKVSADPKGRTVTDELGLLALFIFIILYFVFITPSSMWTTRFYLILCVTSVMPVFLAYVELTRVSALEISGGGIRLETRTVERFLPYDRSLFIDIMLDDEQPDGRPLRGVFISRAGNYVALRITPKEGWRPEDVRAVYEALLPIIDEHGLRTTLLFKEFRANHRGYVLEKQGEVG